MANQPKKYKKFVATAATATLVASAIVPVASAKSFNDVADNNDHKANIDKISDLGYMGTGDNFNPGANLTRGQVAIILANWAQKEAGKTVPADYTTAQRFEDVELTADDKLLQSAALVFDNEIFTGSNGNLLPANDITRLQMALVLNKAYKAVKGVTLVELAGDTSDVVIGDLDKIPAEHQGVVKALKKLGITAPANFDPNGKVTRGQFATFFIKTIEAKAPAAAEVKVESVSATNLKEITVTFDGVLDKTTAEDETNYSLSAGTVSDASLDESGKVVTLTLTAAAGQQDKVDVTVDGVKSEAGVEVAKTTKSVTFFDQSVPSAQKVEVTGPKTVRVWFSEPITSASLTDATNFSVDNNTYSISNVAGTAGDYFVDVTLGSELPEGSHTLKVNALGNVTNAIKDFAGFFVPTTELAYEYKKDTAAPVASVSKASQNSVTIKFDKDIDAATQAYLSVYHTYNNVSGYLGNVSWTDNKTAVVSFPSNYLPVGNATLFVNAGTGSNVVKDKWGNAFASTTLNANITADTTAPTVTEVKVIDSTHIDVTFSEAVTGATTAANYTIKDSAGDAVTVTSAVNTTGNTYRLTTAVLNGGAYTLTVKGMKDTSVAQNALVDYTVALNVKDLVKPTVTNTGVFSTDNKKVVISFDEAMATTGSGSVLSKSNYQVALDGTNYEDLTEFTNSSISLGTDGKSVVIDFGTAQTFVSGTSKVRVGRVADVAGNTTSGFTTDVTLSTDDVALANISKVKAIAPNKVQFEVNTALKSIDVSKFNIETSAGDKAATAATYVNDGNTSTVTVTIADANKFATNLTDLVNVEFGAGALTTQLGTTNSAAVTVLAASVADYVAPELGTISTVDNDGDSKIDTITVAFSENLYVASVQESDFTVEGYEITGVSTGGSTVTLTVKEKSSIDTDATPKVTLVGSVSDNTAQRNSVGNKAAVTAVDGVAPIVVSASEASTTSVTITFSEKLDAATVVAGNFTGTASPSAVSLSADGKTVTVTVAAMSGTETIVVGAGVKDVAGNAITAKTLTRGTDF